jgi:hypothetical protein
VTRLGIRPSADLRTSDEARIVDLLLLFGYAFEVAAGGEAEAREAARADLENLVALGLDFEISAGRRCFDPVEVMNFLVAVGRAGEDGFYLQRHVPTGRRLIRSFHPNDGEAVPSPATLKPRRFTIRLERDFSLDGVQPDERLRLRLPLPVVDRALDTLDIAVSAPPGAEVSRTAASLDVRTTAARVETVALAVDATFTAYPSFADGEALSDAERALYTQPREGLIHVSPAVRAVADAQTGEEADPWRQALAFKDFLFDGFNAGVIHYHQIDPRAPCDWPLETGWFDCQLATALFCALCRARGIPARIVSGYQLYARISCNHYWAEVWTEARGWAPIDFFAAWHLSAGGRDAAWRDIFTGSVDYRMKVEVLPRVFTGLSTVRLPPAWRMMTARGPAGGVEMAFEDIATGAPAYRDRFRVAD